MAEAIEKLAKAYERLQTLQIVPTLTNMEKLLESLYDIRDAYNKLREGEKDGGPKADPE